MITGASHSLSADLASAMQQYRSQMLQQSAEKPDTPAAPIETPPSKEAPGRESSLPSRAEDWVVRADAQRESARRAAVHVTNLNHQQKMVDTYMNASSSGDGNTSSSSLANPSTVYQETLQYNRRMDLISAFERAANPRESGSQISLFS
jgi:hypothetical protein